MATETIPQKYAPNQPGLYTNQFNAAVSGQPKPLPSIAIPDGFQLVIKAKKANTNNITLGFDSNSALNTNTSHFKLAPNESVKLGIINASIVWLDAVVSGEGVELIVEQAKPTG